MHVIFTLPASVRARSIHLVGDFNGWDHKASPMSLSRLDALWTVTVELPLGWRYRYRYLVDGKEWLNDHHADDQDPNEYGSIDSVVALGLLPTGCLHVP